MTIGSLFSGIGGLELGLEWAGLGPIRWQCEIDEFCRSVLAKHWPDATRYDDVRSINESADRVDIICGGFPCQDISNAGKRAGIDGERSGLWSEFARIVRVLRPRVVVVENVGALLGRGMGRVLGDLSACGYDAEWSTLRASDVGAPHRRERVFIVAYADAERRGAERCAADLRARESVPRCGGAVADADGVREARSGDVSAAGAHETGPRDPALADAGCERGERRRSRSELACATGAREGEGAERQRDGNAARDGGAALAHGHGHGREGERRGGVRCELDASRGDDADGRSGARALSDAARAGLSGTNDRQERAGWPDAGRGGVDLADAAGSRREGADGLDGASRESRSALVAERCGDAWRDGGPTKSGVGRGVDGLPAWLDRWPAPPHSQQHDWEPPRAVAEKVANRPARLRALGNAVVPQCAYVVGLRIVEILSQRESEGCVMGDADRTAEVA